MKEYEIVISSKSYSFPEEVSSIIVQSGEDGARAWIYLKSDKKPSLPTPGEAVIINCPDDPDYFIGKVEGSGKDMGLWVIYCTGRANLTLEKPKHSKNEGSISEVEEPPKQKRRKKD